MRLPFITTFPCLRQSEFRFAVFERFSKRADVRLGKIYRQSVFCRLIDYFVQYFFRVSVWRYQYGIIVHIMARAFNVKLTFDVVINRRRQAYHLHLTDLYTERQSVFARNCSDYLVCYFSYVRMPQQLFVAVKNSRVGCRREELLVIHKQNPAFASIASIMLTQIVGKHPHSEMKTFARKTRAVFVYHVWGI